MALATGYYDVNEKRSPVGEHHDNDRHRPRIPTIPDLRFEYSFLRSVKPYVQLVRTPNSPQTPQEHKKLLSAAAVEGDDEELKKQLKDSVAADHASVGTSQAQTQEVIVVQWRKVFWATFKDQIMSPFLQGLLWAIASTYITPFSSQLGSKVGSLVRGSVPSKEGLGITRLRDWAKGLGISSSSNTPGNRSSLRPL
ncbi:hypothetical protein CVT24_010775 [Panaeolus cyanescens]|uniref:Uncharacterized protein n=1 Tax=Panaeolus cyanescens TaxID=181874 RepID=A0A409YMC7_9AGAR|nr:hypothetical protein CVT24_010775 [Panaeolus cyanescens]